MDDKLSFHMPSPNIGLPKTTESFHRAIQEFRNFFPNLSESLLKLLDQFCRKTNVEELKWHHLIVPLIKGA